MSKDDFHEVLTGLVGDTVNSIEMEKVILRAIDEAGNIRQGLRETEKGREKRRKTRERSWNERERETER